MYKCDHCEYTSNRKYYVTLHKNIKHNDSTNYLYKCDKCDKKLSSKQYLIKHQESCKGYINSSKCQKCNKVFSCTSSKCRHFKTCKAEVKKEDNLNPTTINNITNNTTNNITNNTNNIVNNTYIFQSDPNVHPVAYQNYNMQQLSNDVIIPNKNNLQLMMEDFGRLIYNDVQNKNIKKRSSKTKFCLVKNEKGEWVNKLDKDIIPKATKDIAYNFRIIIDDNEIELCNINKKNKSVIPKLTEFLSIIIDYNHELEILNDTDKEDNKLFNDMKDRTICIIIDSSNYK
jgi:hypothetical protein